MKKYFTFLFLFTSLLMVLWSCETDFDTISEFEDITVVYALLDSKDTNMYVKINRAFLTQTDVMTYAMDPDSNQYLNKLEVTIEEYADNGNLVQTFVLDTTTIYNKEAGQFYYPEQIIYNWNRPQFPYEVKYIVEGLNDTVGVDLYWLNEESTYKLTIKNPETGKEITAETPLVKDFRITKPGSGQTVRFVPEPLAPKTFEWELAEHGAKYEFEMRFNYGELMWGSQDTVYKYITLTRTSHNPSSGNSITVSYPDESFFSSCLQLIPYSDPAKENEVKERYTTYVDFIVSVAEENFATYMEVNEPSNSIVQEKPQYTNINNGIGIFSSRYKKVKSKKLHSETISDLISLEDNVLKFKF